MRGYRRAAEANTANHEQAVAALALFMSTSALQYTLNKTDFNCIEATVANHPCAAR
jgi:hypothetical protein